jgi:hypothetical protein
VKTPDGTVKRFLSFAYSLVPHSKITVHLPIDYKSEKLSADGWKTLFQVYSTDYEASLSVMEKNEAEKAVFEEKPASGMGGMAGMPGMSGMPGMPMPGGMPGMPMPGGAAGGVTLPPVGAMGPLPGL